MILWARLVSYHLGIRKGTQYLIPNRGLCPALPTPKHFQKELFNSKFRDSKGIFSQYHKEAYQCLNEDKGKAKDYFSKALQHIIDLKGEKEEMIARTFLDLGKINLNEKNIKEAQINLRQALTWANKSNNDLVNIISEAYYFLGLAMLAKNKETAAQLHFETFLRLEEYCSEIDKKYRAIALIKTAKDPFQSERNRVSQLQEAQTILANEEDPEYILYLAECQQLLSFSYSFRSFFEDFDWDMIYDCGKNCVRILKAKVPPCERSTDLQIKVIDNFLQLACFLLPSEKELALRFLNYADEILKDLYEDPILEAPSLFALIQTYFLDISFIEKEQGKSREIIERIKKANVQEKDFPSKEKHASYLIHLANTCLSLKFYEEAYNVLQKRKECFINHSISIKTSSLSLRTLLNFCSIYCQAAFELGKYKEILEIHQILLKLEEEAGEEENPRRFGENASFVCHTTALKSYLKLGDSEGIYNALPKFVQEWNMQLKLLQNDAITEEIYQLFKLFEANENFDELERLLDEMLSIDRAKNFKRIKKAKLIYAYLIIISSKKAHFSKTIYYIQKAQEVFSLDGITCLNYSGSFVEKMIGKNPLVNLFEEDIEDLKRKNIARDNELLTVITFLWKLIGFCLVEAEGRISLLLIEELQRILQVSSLEQSSKLIFKLQILKIVVSAQVEQPEVTTNLTKEALVSINESKRNIWIPVIYYLEGVAFYMHKQKETAVTKWKKAIDIYLNIRGDEVEEAIDIEVSQLFGDLVREIQHELPEDYQNTIKDKNI